MDQRINNAPSAARMPAAGTQGPPLPIRPGGQGMAAREVLAGRDRLIGEQSGDDADDAEVIIGTETDRGPGAAALVAAGYTVYGVNPLQARPNQVSHGVVDLVRVDGIALGAGHAVVFPVPRPCCRIRRHRNRDGRRVGMVLPTPRRKRCGGYRPRGDRPAHNRRICSMRWNHSINRTRAPSRQGARTRRAGPAELIPLRDRRHGCTWDGGIRRVHYAPCPVTVVCQARL